MHNLRTALGLAVVGVLAAGCQGGALHRIDDKALADLALNEKTQILAGRRRARAGAGGVGPGRGLGRHRPP
ncbi:MAG: hypothetical protein QM765_35370 [Myxococcales bacterium]